MALKPLNSEGGFGLDAGNIIIDANGNILASNLTVTALANLGPVGNITITGGNFGEVLTTDGNGSLSWSAVTSTSNSAAPMPYHIPIGDSYVVPNNFQGLFYEPIDIEGEFEVEGILIDVSGSSGGGGTGTPGGLDTQVQFNDAGTFGGNAGFTFNKTTGVFSVPSISVSGNIIPTANVTYDLGSPNLRFNDLYLAGNTIELGSARLSANATSIILTNPAGGTFAITGNGSASTTALANGSSNVVVNDTSVSISANGNSSVLSITGTGVGVQGTLTATGNITTQSNLSVIGNLVAANISTGGSISATGNLSAGNINTSGDLGLTGNLSAGNISTSGTLGVVGNTSITGNFQVSQETLLQSTLSVGSSNIDDTAVRLYSNGFGRFNNISVVSVSGSGGNISSTNLVVSNTANINTLNVSTISALGNLATTENITATKTITAGNANLGNLATANFFQGDGHLLTNITVQGGTSIVNENSNVSVAPNANVTMSINGIANVVTVYESGLIVDGIANIGNGLYVSGNAEVTEDLVVDGEITVNVVKNGNTSVGLTENGNLSLTANGSTRIQISNTSVNIAGPANVSGALVSSSLNTGAVTATSANVSGNIVSTNANLGNLVTANFFQGDGYLLTNLTIAGGTAIVNGNSNVQVALDGNVTITAEGNANVVTVTGNSVVLDKQIIGNLATFTTGNISTVNANTLNVQNQLTVNSNITANGRVTGETLLIQKVGGNLGTATIQGNLSAQDNLFVSGYANVPTINATTLNLEGSLSSNASVTADTVTARDLLRSQGNFTVTGNSTINSLSATTGNFSGNISGLNANLGNLVTANFFQGDGYLLTNLTIPAGTALVNGDSNLFVDGNGNIRLSIVNSANAFVVSNTGAVLKGTFSANGNANLGNLGTNTILATGNVTASNIVSNGNISGSNITGSGNLNVNGSITSNANIVAINANLGNLVTANFFQGDGYLLTNLTIPAGTALVNGNSNVLVTANSDVNITVEGVPNVVKVTSQGVIVTGNINASNGFGNGTSNISIVENSAINMSVSGTANVLKINSTSINANAKVNLFDGLAVTGNSNVANLGASGNVTVAGEVNAGSLDAAGSLRVAGNSNIANLYATGTITSVGNLTAGNVQTTGTANVAALVVTSDGANITGSTTINGQLNIQNNAIITGNLTIQGNTNYVNVTELVVQDPVIQLGGGPNNTPLTTNDGKDRGSLLHYYTTQPVDAFMGWDNSNSEFAFGSNVSMTNDVVTFNGYGNIRANYFLGNVIGNISGNYVAPGANTNILFNDDGQINATSGMTFNKSSNLINVGNLTVSNTITLTTGTNLGVVYRNSIGQLVTGSNLTFNGTSLTVAGGVTADDFYGNLVKGNSNIAITSNSNISMYIAGNTTPKVVVTTTGLVVNGIANITGNLTAGNVLGGNLVSANFVAGTLTTADQPNITNIGTLSSLTVTGNANVGNIGGAGGVFTSIAGTLTTSAQPNITSIGTLSNLNVSGNASFTGSNVSLGNVSNLKITGGTTGYVLSTDGTGNLSWVAQSGGGGTANIAILDEGSTLTNTVSSINFAGAGVTASANGNAVTVTISGGGAGSMPAEGIFYENDQTISANYTITAGKNAMTTGPITINSGVTVTVPTGSRWVIV